LRTTPKITIRTIGDGDHPVGDPVPPQRRDDAAEQADRHHEDERERGQLERVDERRSEQVRHGDVVLERVPEVAADEVADPVPVLRRDRPVDPVLVVEHRDVVRARERAEHVPPDVARKQLRGREDDHAQHEERDHGEREAFQ
jgi:hypothetical protein